MMFSTKSFGDQVFTDTQLTQDRDNQDDFHYLGVVVHVQDIIKSDLGAAVIMRQTVSFSCDASDEPVQFCRLALGITE
jgi:hypothetical protein